jgi:hypothetical protein
LMGGRGVTGDAVCIRPTSLQDANAMPAHNRIEAAQSRPLFLVSRRPAPIDTVVTWFASI